MSVAYSAPLTQSSTLLTLTVSPVVTLTGTSPETTLPASDAEIEAVVPESGTVALFGLGVAGLAASRRRKQWAASVDGHSVQCQRPVVNSVGRSSAPPAIESWKACACA